MENCYAAFRRQKDDFLDTLMAPRHQFSATHSRNEKNDPGS